MGKNLPQVSFKSASTGSATAKDYTGAQLSDTEDQKEFRGFRAAVGGDVSITSSNNNTVTLTVADNELVPVGGVRINATGTTASNIILFY